MATGLTAAHRSWRIRVFASTWLAYVGFYFCRKPFSSAKSAIGSEYGWDATTLGNIWAAYLIAYAIGQFLASWMGTKIGPRKNVLLGMMLSVGVTLAMGITPSVPILMGLVAVNGLAQATGWSGNVGTMAGWFHKTERGRVMGLWSTNFTIGSLGSGLAMAAVLGAGDRDLIIDIPWLFEIKVVDPDPWRWCFYLGAIVLAVIALQFYINQRNKPEDVGLAPVDDPVTPADESKLKLEDEPRSTLPGGLSREAWTNLLLVGGFYFFAKFVRYAVWSWSAYFLQENYKLSGAEANAYSIVFDLMGIPGVYFTGWISDRYLNSRRAGISLVMMLGMTVSCGLLMMFADSGVTIFVVLLGCVGFTLYGPDALLTGAGAMDIGGRRSATFAAAVISGFGSIGPVVQEVIIPRLYDQKAAQQAGELGPVFALLFGSAALASVFCGVLVLRNRGGKGI
ncbi:MAG: MFS transporter [Deltaproteobacteria bacterium]|nr:MFS transporter [Deltaproteobacteria bacterium]